MNSTLFFLIHNDPFSPFAGGTELHVLDRAAALAFPRAAVCYPFSADAIAVSVINDGRVEAAKHLCFPLKTPLVRSAHSHPEAEELLLSLFEKFGAGAVSAEQMVWFPLNIMRQIKAKALPYVCVLQDYYAVCPSLNLLDVSKALPCAAHEGRPELSGECLTRFFAGSNAAPPCPAGELLAAHQALWSEILNGAERVVFPSGAARDVVAAAHPMLREKFQVIPYGYGACPPLPPRLKPGPRLRVALIGNVSHPVKGAELIIELLPQLRELPIEWHFFGDVDFHNFMSRVDAIGVRRVYHGTYPRSEIIPRLAASGADVALFTSVAAETFSLTLSEAWLAGIPPIVPRLGALGERVATNGLGWIFEPLSAPSAAAQLKELCSHREQVEAMRQELVGFKHTTLEENAAAYRPIYEPLLARPLPIHWRSAGAESELSAAAAEYESRCRLRQQQTLASQPAYKRSVFYGAYRSLKHIIPVSVRASLYKLLVGHKNGGR